MAYRRRRSYRSSRPRRKYTWVRSEISSGVLGGISIGDAFIVDMLWNARQPPAAAGPMAEVGSVPRVSTDTSILPTLKLEDVMIERIRGVIGFHWVTGAGTLPLANYIMGISTDTGAHSQIEADILPAAEISAFDPAAYPACNSVSWMYYTKQFLFFQTQQIGTTGRVHAHQFDVKSRRRLRDWGDNLILVLNPGGLGDATATEVQANFSVLLSHR